MYSKGENIMMKSLQQITLRSLSHASRRTKGRGKLETTSLLSSSSWLDCQQLGTACPHCPGEGWQTPPVSSGAPCGPHLGLSALGHLLCVPRCAKHFTLASAQGEGYVVRTLRPICLTLTPASATRELHMRPWPSSLTPLCLSLLIRKMGITTVLTHWLPHWPRW